MKAAVFYQAGDLRVEERVLPVCGAGQVLLRVRACGICGTDAHIFCGDEGAAKTPAGTVLGHEFAGEVAAVRLIESGRLDVSSVVYATAPLTALPDILADGQKRRAGKYIITM